MSVQEEMALSFSDTDMSPGLFILRPAVSVVDSFFAMDNLQNDWNSEEAIGGWGKWGWRAAGKREKIKREFCRTPIPNSGAAEFLIAKERRRRTR
jgi:hypothetical protein